MATIPKVMTIMGMKTANMAEKAMAVSIIPRRLSSRQIRMVRASAARERMAISSFLRAW
jgi:hypothetical protein